ncbi:MAG: hypothetical protein Q4G69_12220 [Planctomycetia bacterium]|nr:hypothetical protein [Planctomycetia bacterium]
MKKSIALTSMFLFALMFGTICSVRALDQELANELLTSTDQALLIKVMSTPGETPDDIYLKSLAGKRLARIGTDEAIPVLVKMLPSEKLNMSARYALEAMPTAKADEALRKAAAELTGLPQIGVIDSIGTRRDMGSISLLKGLLAKDASAGLKKAVYAALGSIGTAEAADILLAEMKNKPENAFVCNGLADGLLECAETLEAAGNTAKATAVYDAIVNPMFPVFVQKAAAYHGLLIRKGDAASILVDKLQSPKKCCFTGGLKTIRQYNAADMDKIGKAIAEVFPKLDNERKAYVIRALGDRTDDASRAVLFPILVKESANGNDLIKSAIFEALEKVDYDKNAEALSLLDKQIDQVLLSGNTDLLAAAKEASVQAKGKAVDACFLKGLEDLVAKEMMKKSDANAVSGAQTLIDIIADRRIPASVPSLVKIAKTEGCNPAVRNSAVSALSEIVSLNQVPMIFDVLKSEKDQKRVDWILNATCTRLPRESCAAEIVKVFNAAGTAEKQELLPLLKQIGGKTALTCVEQACWNADTVENATKILGEWNTPDDMDAVAAACLKIAKESPNRKYQVRGIRSYIRIPRQFNFPVAQKIAMCKTAFDAASRKEDKALIFDVFTRMKDIASVNAALDYAKIPEFNGQACSTAVSIAEQIALPENASGKKARAALCDAMKRVFELTNNDSLKNRAQKVYDRWK